VVDQNDASHDHI